MMLKKTTLIFLCLFAISLSGCSRFFYYNDEPDDANLVDVSYNAVNTLLQHLRNPLPAGSVVVINSLVNVDDLSQTFSFGRIISDQISSAFHRSGYRIIGMELPTEIFAKNDSGILYLSDETKQALNETGASALVVGVFAPGKRNAYISLKVYDITSENVISSADLSVPMGPDAKNLLKPKKVDEKPKPAEGDAIAMDSIE